MDLSVLDNLVWHAFSIDLVGLQEFKKKKNMERSNSIFDINPIKL